MIDNNLNVQEYEGNFGLKTDLQGNILNPTITIEGVEVAKEMLQDCLMMACSCAEARQDIEDKNVRAFIVDALTIYHVLDGFDKEEAVETAEAALLIMEHDKRRNL